MSRLPSGPRPRRATRCRKTSVRSRFRRDIGYNKLSIKEPAMDEPPREPTAIRAEDINPRYNWGRALPALGITAVDFEERVDYRRLHRYRLGRGEPGPGK